LPFKRYVGVDMSSANVRHLTDRFSQSDIEIIEGDIETVVIDDAVDSVLSSLTLKHLYPSFVAALRNVAEHLNPGAVLIFDLVEGTYAGFSDVDAVTFSRWYSRDEVRELLQEIPLELVAFDEVQHDPEFTRLLVVARQPSGT
jgi:hypothetical protein